MASRGERPIARDLPSGGRPRVLLAVAILVLGGLSTRAPTSAARSSTVPRAATCQETNSYPGDDASKSAIAGWMARGSSAAALPRELPVMGALEESGLRNLPPADDRAGFFQMRVSIWNSGPYAGFPEQPSLQLRWFTDQAAEVRRQRIADGRPDPAADEHQWGDWVADVLRPPEQSRGRYQLRLAEARELVGAPCDMTATPGAPTPPSAGTDVVGPVTRVVAARRQRALLRRAVLVAVACPAEACTVAATGTVSVPGAARVLRISAPPRRVAAGRRATLRLRLKPRVRAAVRHALRRRPSVPVTLRVIVTDAARNRTTRTRRLRIVR